MKKFGKIISLFVLVVMIVGIFVTNASAYTNTEYLKITDIDGVKSTVKNSFPHDGSGTSSMAYDADSKFAQSSFGYAVSTLFGNKYVRYYVKDTVSQGHTKSVDDAFWGFRLRDASNGFMENDFQVIDFDVVADKYITSYKLFFGEDYELLEADELGFARYKDTKAYYDGNINEEGVQKVYYAINQTLISSTYSKTATEGPFTEFSKAVTIGDTKYAVGDKYYEGGELVSYNDIIARMPAVYIDAADAIHGTGANEGYLVKRANPTERYTIKGAKGQDIEVPLSEVDLSYNNGSYQEYFFGATSGDNLQGKFTMYTFRASDGNWYFTASNSASKAKTNGVKLSSVAGEWNHITIVLAYDNSVNYTLEDGAIVTSSYNSAIVAGIDTAKADGASFEYEGAKYIDYSYNITNSKAYFYMNGEYFYEKTIFSSPKYGTMTANDTLYDIRNRVVEDARFHERFSIGYDNLAFHNYVDGYSGPLAEFIATDPTRPIYTLPDVLYSAKRNYNVPNEYAAVAIYESADSKTPVFETDILYKIDEKITADSYVKISVDIEDFSPKCNFYYQSLGGATLTLSASSGYKIVESEIDSWYYVTEVSEDEFITVNWYASKDSEHPIYTLDKIQVGSKIEYIGEWAPVITYVGDNVYSVFNAWAYTLSGSETPLGTETVSEELFRLAKENGGVISLYPSYENKTVAISVKLADGGYKLYESASDFASATSSLANGATLTLYTDVDIETKKTVVSIAAGRSVSFDLNGHTLTQNKAEDEGILFNLGKGATINLYSSKVGAKIIQSGNSRVFDADVVGVTINIGNAGDVCGDDAKLTILASRMIDVSSAHTYLADNTDPEKPIRFNIFGLNFSSNKQLNSYAAFGARTLMEINATNSNFAVIGNKGNSNDARLLTTDGRYHSKLTAKFDNCSIYVLSMNEKANTVIKELTRGSRVTFKDCKIFGTTSISTGLVHGVTVGLPYYPALSGETAEEKAAREELNKTNKNTSSTFYSPESKAPGYTNLASSYSGSGVVTIEGDTYLAGSSSLGSRVTVAEGCAKAESNCGATIDYYTIDGKVTEEITYKIAILSTESNNIAKVTFEGGEVEYWQVGSTFDRPLADGEPTELYYDKFTGWAKDGEIITSFVAGEYTLTPVYTKIMDVQGIKVNVTGSSVFTVNFYIPASYSIAPSVKSDGKVTYDGIRYSIYRIEGIAPQNIESVKLTLTVIVDAKEYIQEIGISLPEYFGAVLSNSEETIEAKTFVANTVKYCNESYKLSVNAEGCAEYNAILTEYAAFIKKPGSEGVNTISENKYVVKPLVVNIESKLYFALVKGESDSEVSVRYTDKDGTEVAKKCTETKYTLDGSELTIYVVEETSIYDMTNVMHVYHKDTEIGTFDLVWCIAQSKSAPDSAFYGYAITARDYLATLETKVEADSE